MKGKLTVKDLLYFQEEVIRWNETFGNMRDDRSLSETYFNLTKEEFYGKGEYLDSVNNEDLVGELDGLVDMIFTGFFWAVLEGNSLNRVNTRGILSASRGSRFIAEDLDEMLAIGITDSILVREVLIDLLYGRMYQFDIKGAFKRVLKSNYSKAINIQSDVEISEELATIEKEGRYTELTLETKECYIILKACKDKQEGKYYPQGKIIKSSLFKSPEDLGGLNEFIY